MINWSDPAVALINYSIGTQHSNLLVNNNYLYLFFNKLEKIPASVQLPSLTFMIYIQFWLQWFPQTVQKTWDSRG